MFLREKEAKIGKIKEIDLFELLIYQVYLIKDHLKIEWQLKSNESFKYPNLSKLKYDLSNDAFFLEGLFDQALTYLMNHGNIIIQKDSSGIKRVLGPEKGEF